MRGNDYNLVKSNLSYHDMANRKSGTIQRKDNPLLRQTLRPRCPPINTTSIHYNESMLQKYSNFLHLQ